MGREIRTHMQTLFRSEADEIRRSHGQRSVSLLAVRVWDTAQRKSQLTTCHCGGTDLYPRVVSD